MSLAADVIAHCERFRITQGHGAGENLKLLPFQRRFIRGALTTPGPALLSCARGSGKSTLAGALASCALGRAPLAQPRGEVMIVASSFAQGRIVFEALLAGLPDDVLAECAVRNSQSHASITHKPTGSRIRALGNDYRRLMGGQIVGAILDEPAAWLPTTRDAAYRAVSMSAGKIPGGFGVIAIGTQSADPDHWFQKAMEPGRPGYVQVHAAGPDDPPLAIRSAEKACPSLKVFPTLREQVKLEAQEARRDESMMQAYRNLRLNQPVDLMAESLLIDASTWREAEGESEPDGWFVLAADLGSSAAMTAMSAFWPETGRLDAFAAFPSIPSLQERERADHVPAGLYRKMFAREELLQAGERTTDVAACLAEAYRRWGTPAMIVSDAWRRAELLDAAATAGVPTTRLELRRQGWKEGGEDVRAFQRAVVEGNVTPVKSLLLRHAMSVARTVSDPTGAQKMRKRPRQRDDAAAASVLAVAAGRRHRRNVQPEQVRSVLV